MSKNVLESLKISCIKFPFKTMKIREDRFGLTNIFYVNGENTTKKKNRADQGLYLGGTAVGEENISRTRAYSPGARHTCLVRAPSRVYASTVRRTSAVSPEQGSSTLADLSRLISIHHAPHDIFRCNRKFSNKTKQKSQILNPLRRNEIIIFGEINKNPY